MRSQLQVRWQLQSLSLYADLLRLSIRIMRAITVVIIVTGMLWWLGAMTPEWDWRSGTPVITPQRLELAALRGAVPTWPIGLASRGD